LGGGQIPYVLLTGTPLAGKTTLLDKLRSKLECPVIDMDWMGYHPVVNKGPTTAQVNRREWHQRRELIEELKKDGTLLLGGMATNLPDLLVYFDKIFWLEAEPSEEELASRAIQSGVSANEYRGWISGANKMKDLIPADKLETIDRESGEAQILAFITGKGSELTDNPGSDAEGNPGNSEEPGRPEASHTIRIVVDGKEWWNHKDEDKSQLIERATEASKAEGKEGHIDEQ
jgi:broad-specificity NMP kinase